MTGERETEQLQNFNERLNAWVSGQGFWFQLRHSMGGVGQNGVLTFHLVRLFSRLVIFLLVVAVGFWIYVATRTVTMGFGEDLRDGLERAFAAEKIEMRGGVRQKGEFVITRLGMIGGEETFFEELELRNVKCRMEMFDGIIGAWEPGVVQIGQMNVELRAGADSPESAAAIGDVLFGGSGGVKVNAFNVADATIRWGFSETTRGGVVGSKMTARRVGDGWRLVFKGGSFSQGWLRRLEIVEFVVLCGREGILIEKGDFRRGEGSVGFENVKIRGGERPDVSGHVVMRRMGLAGLMPPVARSYVEGLISGRFEVSGSTNSVEGLAFAGEVILDGDSHVVLRDRVHLLRALSVVDAFNTYRRLDFREGGFHLRVEGGSMRLSEVNLTAGDLFQIKGEMVVRAPTFAERQAMRQGSGGGGLGGGLTDEEILAGSDFDFSLKSAAQAGGDGERDSLLERMGLTSEERIEEVRTALMNTRELRYEGEFEISLQKDAFVRAPLLAERYPADAASGRILMGVPVSGGLFELTEAQADEIYRQGAR